MADIFPLTRNTVPEIDTVRLGTVISSKTIDATGLHIMAVVGLLRSFCSFLCPVSTNERTFLKQYPCFQQYWADQTNTRCVDFENKSPSCVPFNHTLPFFFRALPCWLQRIFFDLLFLDQGFPSLFQDDPMTTLKCPVRPQVNIYFFKKL